MKLETTPEFKVKKETKKEKEKEEDNNAGALHDFDKSKSVYHSCIKIYSDWILDKTGATAKIDGGEGKAMKTIIQHLGRQEKIAGNPEKIIDSWKYILSQWNKLNPFLSGRKNLKQISSEFNNIIDQIKNGSTQKGRKRVVTDDELAREITRAFGSDKTG